MRSHGFPEVRIRFGLRCSSLAATLLPVGQRVARSLPERWPTACREGSHLKPVQGHRLALEGAAQSLPLRKGGQGMDAKARDLALFASITVRTEFIY